MKVKYFSVVVSILLLVGITCTAHLLGGKKFSGKGKGIHSPLSDEVEKLADGRTLHHVRQQGFLLPDDEDHPEQLASIDCSGIQVWESDGKRWNGSGTCITIDRDGDTAFSWWEGTEKSTNWGYLRGTGKFEGVKGSGVARTVEKLANGKWIEEWEGTTELK
jgi:hypothetical protein